MACEGCGTSSCCCGEITRIKGGIHPEHLRTRTKVLEANRRYQLTNIPSHFCTAVMGIQKLAADKYVTIRIFSSEDPDDTSLDSTRLMFSLVSGQGQIESTKHAYGLPFLGGIFVECLSEDDNSRVFINMVTVDRDNFSPAYQRSEYT